MLSRDELGRIVREAWIACCLSIGDTKQSHLTPYDELNDSDKEADRQIGEAVVNAMRAEYMREAKYVLDKRGRA